jgi:primosomal protein N' (replication factor Y)
MAPEPYNSYMQYYEVLIADSRYHSDSPLTYSSENPLRPHSVVTVPLKKYMVTAFVIHEVDKPKFAVKPIKNLLSSTALPEYSIELARWLSSYYACSLGEALRQFAPTKPSIRSSAKPSFELEPSVEQLELDVPLTTEQQAALKAINASKSHTILLHGETGSGKTRLYIELARDVINKGKSVILLTPEIALTSQLATAVESQLHATTIILHSQLSVAQRKKLWLQVLEATEPIVIIGPRSALFSPVANLGLIVLDEAHEPAYKQDQSPRYHALRIASQLGVLNDSKVILGTATPLITDFYLASERAAVVEMKTQALTGEKSTVLSEVIDIKDRRNFGANPYLSDKLIEEVRKTLTAGKQAMIYLNRRGTARLVMCDNCGWQLLCLHCHIPLVYHADTHKGICHICGHTERPPNACPQCGNPDVIYKSIGTKALIENLTKLFPEFKIARFDSDNQPGERLNELYPKARRGEIDILVGTQLLAKGFDFPKLGLVGIINAEASLALPDYSAEERAFQLLYQVIGRVGRGHGHGKVVVQTYEPGSPILQAAINRDWHTFYDYVIAERQQFRFPPFSYLMQLVCRRATQKGAINAADNLRAELAGQGLSVEIIGPAPSFYEHRGKYFYWQLVVKSKNRGDLVKLAAKVPPNWMIDLDPINLL